MFLPANDQRLFTDIQQELSVVREGVSPVERALPQVARLLRAEKAGAYGVEEWEGAFRPRFVHSFGVEASLYANKIAQVVSSTRRRPSRRFAWFDPDRPEAWQRNTVVTYADLQARQPRRRVPMQSAAGALGIVLEEQLRVLVCDGPSMLGLVAVYREEPWRQREHGLLARLVPPLRRRLRLERSLASAPLMGAALQRVFEAIAAPVFLLDGHGHVVVANVPGKVALGQGGREQRRALRDAMNANAIGAPGTPSGFRVTRVVARGMGDHYLVIARQPPDGDRLAQASAQRWRLSRRQTQVLVWIVRGEGTARIAAELGISDRTVEDHVAAVLAKADVASRAQLMAAVLSKPVL